MRTIWLSSKQLLSIINIRERQHDKETGEEYIETTLEDIAEANKLLKDILIRKSDPLNAAC